MTPYDTPGWNTSPAKGAPWALIVDDHPLFCDALELTLRSVTGFAAVRTADSLEAAVALLEDFPPPGLILLDLNLPDVSGLDGLARLRQVSGGSKIIVVSSMAGDSVINGAIASGASGFVPKHSRRSVFKEAIDRIGAGGVFTPEGFVRDTRPARTDTRQARLASLTNQQARILGMICEGKLNKQIAFDLSIAETTVKAHVTAIMRKLGVQSRTQAVLAAHGAAMSKGLPN